MNVNDINDNVPTFPRDYEGPFDVTEGQPGPRVWTFLAHDRDSGPNGQVEYSIVDGDPLGEWGLRWAVGAAQPEGLLAPTPTQEKEKGGLEVVSPPPCDLALPGLQFPIHHTMNIVFPRRHGGNILKSENGDW